ncbi:rod shape-determining protein RodA [Rhodohalobacter sp. SW132]|uniref:FtsW/RodA/SpoVE family cell cycle protein n=1 Tax=Rhodohalobacter sp. SW132 TaxID=2293433 RepID=UPI000E22FBD3|nr:FtsW/RodA/SpoVE family cell cycle protein [Rhodohalobacter sp. SW132]REL33113.1 rod shape-determining protein RodA [Rhodohalobacter sp. SW132]
MINIKDFSWSVIFIWLAIAAIGLVAIYSATLGEVSQFLPAAIQNNFFRQSTWIGISIVALITTQFISPRAFQSLSYVIYAICLVLAIVTIFVGIEVGGGRRWLSIFGFRLQVSEFLKLATILAVANYLTHKRNMSVGNVKTAITTVGLILLPVAIIILQNDTGTALILLTLIPVVLFWSGLPYGLSLLMISPAIIGYFSVIGLTFGAIAALIITIFIFFLQRQKWLTVSAAILGLLVVVGTEVALQQILQPHQRARVEAFVNPSLDPHGAGWNVLQAKTAIGSGGLSGKGFMEGTQTQLRFLPEQWTDFVYCVVGEEFGFLGSSLLIILYGFLFLKLLSMAGAHKHPFAQLVLVCVTFIYFAHFIVNVGSATAMLPIMGVPLPFVSYGGSAFLANTLMLAVCLNLDLYKRSFSIYR